MAVPGLLGQCGRTAIFGDPSVSQRPFRDQTPCNAMAGPCKATRRWYGAQLTKTMDIPKIVCYAQDAASIAAIVVESEQCLLFSIKEDQL